MSLEERIRERIDALTLIEDKQERLAWITEEGKRAPGMSAGEKTEAEVVPGCVSRVWLSVTYEGSRVRVRYDAESPMVKGLVHALLSVYDGAEAAEVVADQTHLLQVAGLLDNLTPTRKNGLMAVRRRLTELARAAE